MGNLMTRRSLNVVDFLGKQGIEEVVSLEALKSAISHVVGGNRGTIKNYLTHMSTIGLIESLDNKNLKISPEKHLALYKFEYGSLGAKA